MLGAGELFRPSAEQHWVTRVYFEYARDEATQTQNVILKELLENELKRLAR